VQPPPKRLNRRLANGLSWGTVYQADAIEKSLFRDTDNTSKWIESINTVAFGE
jgi:hypothetical protein